MKWSVRGKSAEIWSLENILFMSGPSPSSALTDASRAGTDPLLDDALLMRRAGALNLGDGPPGESAAMLSRSSAPMNAALPVLEAEVGSCLRFKFLWDFP